MIAFSHEGATKVRSKQFSEFGWRPIQNAIHTGFLITLSRPWYLNLGIMLPSYNFHILTFLLQIRVAILLLLRYMIRLLCYVCQYTSHYSSIYHILSYIFLLSQYPPPLKFSLLCLSIIYAYNLSFHILQSHHRILPLLF